MTSLDMSKSLEFSYSVYGLGVRSFVRLPDLVEDDLTDDITIRRGSVAGTSEVEALTEVTVFQRPGLKSSVSQAGIVLEVDKVGAFLIRDGCEVLVEAEAGVTDADLQPFLIGPVLAILLHQRGLMVLHSSAVLMNGSAVAFLGNKGYGKSTLAAHFYARDYTIISDDLVPVSFEHDYPLTFPGFPKLKLYEDSIEAVGSNPSDFPLIHRYVEKRSFHCVDRFSTKAVKLAAIFVLTASDEFGIQELSQGSAFLELTKHTFLNRYLEALKCQAQHFIQCQTLVETMPIFELKRPHRFDQMDRVIDLVEDYMKDLVEILDQRPYLEQ